MTRFQLIFTGVLVFCAVAGIALFAVARSNNSQSVPQVTLWGTLPASQVNAFLGEASFRYQDQINVVYVEKQENTFESELVAALARGQGPDMVLLPQDLILKQIDKFYPIPYENYSERTFKDTFIEEGEMYMIPTGVLGLPFSVDPMVMYWNRQIVSDAGISLPPASWTELYTIAPQIIKKDAGGNITQALVAMGSTANVTHAKDIIALLAIQAGTPIVSRDSHGNLQSVFSQNQGQVPGEQAVNFYTEFSNPLKPAYTWNRSLGLDRDMFVAGKLAMYFGYASELSTIRAANPNLNFDVALMPQTSGAKATFGRMNAFAFLKTSPNLTAAVQMANLMTGADLESVWTSQTNLPPVRRDLLTTTPSSAYLATFYRSALMAKAWLDPYREATTDVFNRLIDNVTSGRYRTSQAVSTANSELDTLIRTYVQQ